MPHFQRLRNGEGSEADAIDMSWLASRRLAPAVLGGTETRLMLRDPQFDPALPADGVLSLDTLCCNRDLPSLLPFGGGQPHLRIIGSGRARTHRPNVSRRPLRPSGRNCANGAAGGWSRISLSTISA